MEYYDVWYDWILVGTYLCNSESEAISIAKLDPQFLEETKDLELDDELFISEIDPFMSIDLPHAGGFYD